MKTKLKTQYIYAIRVPINYKHSYWKPGSWIREWDPGEDVHGPCTSSFQPVANAADASFYIESGDAAEALKERGGGNYFEIVKFKYQVAM